MKALGLFACALVALPLLTAAALAVATIVTGKDFS